MRLAGFHKHKPAPDQRSLAKPGKPVESAIN